MLKYIAKTLSVILHPLLLPTYFLIILFNTDSFITYYNAGIQRIIIILVFVTTFMLPISSIPVLLNMRIIKNLQIDEAKDRIIPMIITTTSFIASYYFLVLLPIPIPTTIKSFLLGSTIAVFLSLLITLKWKISAHAIGIGGLIGATIAFSFLFAADFLILILFMVFAAGLIGFSRLYLNAHTPTQLYTGFVLGFIILFLSMFLL